MSLRPRIVVAEDDRGVRDLIRMRLEMAGYDVFPVRNGAEAVAAVHSIRPQAVVLDINMPELDGFGVLTALADYFAQVRLPVLVLSARHAAEDVQRAVKLGARDYLTKPFSEQQLLSRMARLLRPPPPKPEPEPKPEPDSVFI